METLFAVCYEDDDVAVISKPPKMLTHRTEIANGDTVFALQEVREQFGRKVFPVYRLDRGTSGLLMFAFSPEAASYLSALATENFHKRYAALVRGFTPEEVLIDHPLKPPVDPYLRVQKTGPQDAVTHLRTAGHRTLNVPCGKFSSTRLSLVALELGTGRRHQLRRHMKHLSHPIIGDATYGKGEMNRTLAPILGSDRLMLHCAAIQFKRPSDGKLILVEDKAEPSFNGMIEALDLKDEWETLFALPFHDFDR